MHPPVISVTPANLTQSLFTGQQASQTISIDNSPGGSDLIWAASVNNVAAPTTLLYNENLHQQTYVIEENGTGADRGKVAPISLDQIESLSGEVRILAWTKYADLAREYVNTLNAITQYFSDYTVTQTQESDSAAFGALLEDYDLLLIPEQEGGNVNEFIDLGTSWSAILDNFVRSGGSVIMCGGISGQQEILNASNLMNMNSRGNRSSGTMNVLDTTNFLVGGLGTTIPINNATFFVNITDSLATEIVASTSDDIAVAFKELGFGKMFYLGYDFFDYDDAAARIISNAVSSTTGRISWLSLDILSDTVSASSSLDVGVNFDAARLLGGSYDAVITLESNDPDNSIVEIPVNMLVTGVADITIAQDTLDFNSIFAGDTTQLTLIIENEGTDTLRSTSGTSYF